MPVFSLRSKLVTRLVAAAGAVALAGSGLGARPAAASSNVIGSGSSFAGIELQEWSKDVAAPPYTLNVNYQSSSSGAGRSQFRDGVVDFAVSDIRYVPEDGSAPDPNSFIYVPVTAGGLAIMYNLQAHGLTTANPINLSSLTLCGIFTQALSYWDDKPIQDDNPNVKLPHVPIQPIVRSDQAGTNFVLEEYCIATHNDLYAAFAATATQRTQTDYPDRPTSVWPIVGGIKGADGSDKAADTVASSNADGYVTAVETGYANQKGFPAASVQNDTGAFVQPTDTAVATALSYATQRDDGTHVLTFTPGDPKAYNPSTYSYMLLRIGSGADPGKGATLTAFANYDLTIGQSQASRLGYASIGRALIEYGLAHLKVVPGYVAPTSAELAAVPADQQVTQHAPVQSPSGGAAAVGTTTAAVGASPGASTAAAATPSETAGASASAPSGVGGTGQSVAGGAVLGGAARPGGAVKAGSSPSAADASVSLGSQTGPLGQTGIEGDLLAGIGTACLAAGEVWRRVARRPRGRP